jgi:hypothetical protein
VYNIYFQCLNNILWHLITFKSIKITLLVKNIFSVSFILKIIVTLLTVYLKYKNVSFQAIGNCIMCIWLTVYDSEFDSLIEGFIID